MTVRTIMTCDICGREVVDGELYVGITLYEKQMGPDYDVRGYVGRTTAKFEGQAHVECAKSNSLILFIDLDEKYEEEATAKHAAPAPRVHKGFDKLPILEEGESVFGVIDSMDEESEDV